MKEKKLKLSPKHGLNPTIGICYFCHRDSGEITLLGRIDKEDSEAPRHTIVSRKPCAECSKIMETSILLIGTNTENGDRFGFWNISEDKVKYFLLTKHSLNIFLRLEQHS